MPDASPAPAAGSSSPGATSTAGQGFDACSILSPEDLTILLGGSEPTPKPAPGGGWVAGQCAWSGPTAAFLISVGTRESIASVGNTKVADAKSKLAEFGERASATGGAQPIPGLGDGAIQAGGTVAAYKGDVYLEVLNLRLTDEQAIEVMKLAVAGV